MHVIRKLGSAVTFLFMTFIAIVRPIAKAVGLLFIILGAIFCSTFVGAVIGVPLILIGGILLFA